MRITERYAELVAGAETDMPLDEVALLIAAHAHEGVDVPEGLRTLDQLAASTDADDGAALARYLFVEQGFAGNTVDYGDPENSLLDVVLRRRLGIPITLSVIMLAVGRRRSITLHGVGMPGHFLVGDGARFFDPFHAGASLDVDGCIALFSGNHPRDAFRPEYLEPIGSRRIVDRILANLQHSYLARRPVSAIWTAHLRLLLPDQPATTRVELAGVLGRLGRFAEAARVLDAAADDLPAEHDDVTRRMAARLRARAN